MQQAAVQGLGQRSGHSGSTIFRGTRCSEDAQLQIQPRALLSPPCRSLQTQRHFCAWRLQGCRGQMQGVLCGFLFIPPSSLPLETKSPCVLETFSFSCKPP